MQHYINNKEIDIRSVENFPIEAICNNYKFYINSDFTVDYICKANETIVTYTTEPEGYTNKDNVKILITISNSKGIKSIQYPNHNNVSANEKTKVVIDYEVTANGIYSFKIIDVEEINNLISGDYKVYVIAYDKAGNSKKSNVIYTSVVRKNIWNLGIQNDMFETYQGTPEYKGEEEGLYLSNNSVVSTKSNFNLNDFYTIIIEVKDIKSIGVGFMLAMGNGGRNIGAQYLGICNWPNNYICAMSGAGDQYTLNADNPKLYSADKWNILAIKYNGTEFSFFIDGKKIGSSGYSILKQSKLYIGGISNSGFSDVGYYWGYGEGYYRNLAIYDSALSDEELENYEF